MQCCELKESESLSNAFTYMNMYRVSRQVLNTLLSNISENIKVKESYISTNEVNYILFFIRSGLFRKLNTQQYSVMAEKLLSNSHFKSVVLSNSQRAKRAMYH